jgi:Family of unknown function (DUF5996)
MTLPPLNTWETSSHSLHRAAQLLGAIRMLVRESVPNFLELALRIEPYGLSTDTLPSGGTVVLDFNKAAVNVNTKDGEYICIHLEGHTQASLLETILKVLASQGQGLVNKKGDSFTEAFLSALHAKGHKLDGSLEVSSTEPLNVDAKVSAEYSEALYGVFTATARWKAKLVGQQTPIVVWPEHFDLSTLWFATDKATESSPHINFGFAPFDGTHTRPYLYAYAYPMPKEFEKLPLPQPAQWHTAPWKGVYVPYDELAKADNPEALIENLFEAIYNTLSPTLKPVVAA